MAVSSHLPLFPSTVWLRVFECETLSSADLYRTGATCHALGAFVRRENRLWRSKFAQRWPQMYEQLVRRVGLGCQTWIEHYRHRQLMIPLSRRLLARFSAMMVRHERGLHVAYAMIRTAFCDDETTRLYGAYYTMLMVDQLRCIINDGRP